MFDAQGNPVSSPKMNVSMDQMENVLCECGNETFDMHYVLKVVPAMYSPTGKKAIAPMPQFLCSKCGKVITLEM